MKVETGAKITLTALELLLLLDDAMETLCLRLEDGQEVDTMLLAKEKTLELIKKIK